MTQGWPGTGKPGHTAPSRGRSSGPLCWDRGMIPDDRGSRAADTHRGERLLSAVIRPAENIPRNNTRGTFQSSSYEMMLLPTWEKKAIMDQDSGQLVQSSGGLEETVNDYGHDEDVGRAKARAERCKTPALLGHVWRLLWLSDNEE